MPDDDPKPVDPIPSNLARPDKEFAEIVEQFLRDMPAKVEQIEQAVAIQDFDTVQQHAQTIKGRGEGHGFQAVAAAAARLEREAIAQQLDACTRDVENLKRLISGLLAGSDGPR